VDPSGLVVLKPDTAESVAGHCGVPVRAGQEGVAVGLPFPEGQRRGRAVPAVHAGRAAGGVVRAQRQAAAPVQRLCRQAGGVEHGDSPAGVDAVHPHRPVGQVVDVLERGAPELVDDAQYVAAHVVRAAFGVPRRARHATASDPADIAAEPVENPGDWQVTQLRRDGRRERSRRRSQVVLVVLGDRPRRRRRAVRVGEVGGHAEDRPAQGAVWVTRQRHATQRVVRHRDPPAQRRLGLGLEGPTSREERLVAFNHPAFVVPHRPATDHDPIGERGTGRGRRRPARHRFRYAAAVVD
jgi:hypothetical protein